MSETTPRELFALDKRDTVFICLLTVSAVLLSAIGLFGGFMLGFTVSFVLTFMLSNLYLCKKGVRLTPFAIASAILTVAVSCVFSVTTGGTIRFFGFVISMLSALAWGGTVTGNVGTGDLGVLSTIFSPLCHLALPHIPTTVRSVFAGNGSKRNMIGKALIGIAASIPVLLVVVPLLIRSDKAFDGLAQLVQKDLLLLLAKIAVGGLIALPVASYCVALNKKKLPTPAPRTARGVDTTVLVSFLSVLSLCYLAYLFSQLAYFFSAFSGLLPPNYTLTLSAYARRGFFEMCIVAAINAVIIFTVLLLSRKKDAKPPVAIRVLCAFISVFTLVIIATALSKMVLYIMEFGMTVLRIGTGTFTVFLGVVFIAIILRLFIPRVEVLKTALLTAGLLIALLGIVNMNAVVARYNYTAYKNDALDTIDVYTIEDMGSEGVPYLAALVKDDDPDVAAIAQECLLRQYSNEEYYETEIVYVESEMQYHIKAKKHASLSRFNVARNTAYKVLDYYIDLLPQVMWEQS